MIKVGLTGGIGSGKTTVAQLFELLRIPVYYADKEAKRLMHEDANLQKAIQSVFGKAIYSNGYLDRKALAAIVFKDAKVLAKLNSLVHPVVREDFLSWANRQQAAYVVEESAILFETELYKEFDCIVSVLCPMEERVDRLLKRDANTKAEIQARMSAQIDDKIREEKSDYLLQNAKDDLLLPQIIALDKAIKERKNI